MNQNEIYRELFNRMLRIRLIEERIAELYSEQEMRCPVHLCIGQEAISSAVGLSLDRKDYVLSGHRSHGHYLAKGGNLKAMMAELYGKATGCSRGKGGSMHLVDLSVGFLGATPIVGSTIPIAVGSAFGTVLRGESNITVIFFGEGATEEGVFSEAVNFASLKKLPVIFVCENNLYSVYSPIEVRQPEGHSYVSIAKGYGVESYSGNGNDVVQIYELMQQAVSRARNGNGPTFLELRTYRWREHCGPNFDNDIGYRTEKEFQEWEKRCPVTTFRNRLIQEELLTDDQVNKTTAEINREMDEAVEFAKSSPFPDAEEMMKGIYFEMPSPVKAVSDV